MQIKIIIGTVAFMLTMILLGFYSLLEPNRMANFTDARAGRRTEKGAEIYYANCATCHGENGKGTNGGECYDANGEPWPCQGRPLNDRGLLCGVEGDKSSRMIDRGWPGTKFGFVHDTIMSGRQGGVMVPWGQEYGGPLQEDGVTNATLFVLNWETEELCDFIPVAFPWPDNSEDANAFENWPAITPENVIEENDIQDADEIPFELPLQFPGDAANGYDLYVNGYACSSCHGDPTESDWASWSGTGPSHGDMAVNAPLRVDGVSAESYIAQSILYPSSYVVDEYADAMQSYLPQMGQNPQDFLDIITFLLEQDG